MSELLAVARKIQRGLERRGVPARIVEEANVVYIRGSYAGELFSWRVRLLTVGTRRP
jgi:hypothetical protein